MATLAPRDANQAVLFRELARRYDHDIQAYQPTYDAMLRLSTDLARSSAPAGARCLDYGTGTGAALPLLNAQFAEVVAIDPGRAMLDLARRRVTAEGAGAAAAQVSFIEGTHTAPASTSLETGSFDAVHCSLVLMFVTDDPEKLEVLRFFHRLLRPGGTLVLTELVVDEDPGSEQATLAMWRSLMRQRGAADEFVATAERQVHDLMHRRTVGEVRTLLEQVGFRRVVHPFQTLHTVMFVGSK